MFFNSLNFMRKIILEFRIKNQALHRVQHTPPNKNKLFITTLLFLVNILSTIAVLYFNTLRPKTGIFRIIKKRIYIQEGIITIA